MNDLTKVESEKREDCEQIIRDGLDEFVKVGRALAIIRDQKLYRSTHKTFEAYCAEMWNISRRYATYLINGSKTAEELSEYPSALECEGSCTDNSGDVQVVYKTGTNGSHSVHHSVHDTNGVEPTTLRQVRPLTGLPVEAKRQVWSEAVAESNGKAPTAKTVEEKVQAYKEEVAKSRNGACPHCGGRAFDEDGDCAKCHEPAVVSVKAARAAPRTNGHGKTKGKSHKPPEKEATPTENANAQVKVWADTVGRWLSQSPSIDELRGKFPGPKGDAVVKAATALYESLKHWQKALK